MTYVYWIIFFLIIYIIWRVNDQSNKVVQVRGHWQHYFENVQFSSLDFYNTIETVIREKEIINLQTSRITYAEGSILSANREYLRISRGTIVFDICAAPFAKGFFISSWQGDLPDLTMLFLTKLPLIGKGIERSFYRKTYFQMDSEQMYISSVHSGILEAIDKITNAQGTRSLTQHERIFRNDNSTNLTTMRELQLA